MIVRLFKKTSVCVFWILPFFVHLNWYLCVYILLFFFGSCFCFFPLFLIYFRLGFSFHRGIPAGDEGAEKDGRDGVWLRSGGAEHDSGGYWGALPSLTVNKKKSRNQKKKKKNCGTGFIPLPGVVVYNNSLITAGYLLLTFPNVTVTADFFLCF